MDEDKVLKGSIIAMGSVFALVLFLAISNALISPIFEAQSWNKLTGGNASYWDAFWLDLQVGCGGDRHDSNDQ